VTELIPQLIEAGVDVLDPIQPECMDFREIFDTYGDRLSFRGTIGTQSVMPFGTPEDVRRKVFENLDIAGPMGGLYVCPTHLLEPEVPVENVEAYILACRDYTERI
jgi:uroporphyrinogen decarboxylase